jgi:hypothetical protein
LSSILRSCLLSREASHTHDEKRLVSGLKCDRALYHVINRGNYQHAVFASAGAATAFERLKSIPRGRSSRFRLRAPEIVRLAPGAATWDLRRSRG